MTYKQLVVQRRTPGKSGYFGVSERHGRYVAQIVVEVFAHQEPCHVLKDVVVLN
jgi:hypothetical protein